MTQFNRRATVTVGFPGKEALRINSLRIAFSINKTRDKEPNTGQITIWNLSESSRNKIEKKQKIFLDAGYVDEDNISTIFIGDVQEVSHKKIQPDIITEIKALDGGDAILTKQSKMSFANGISGRTILNTALSDFGLTLDLGSTVIPNKSYANGFSFVGPTYQVIDKVSKFLGMGWSIQNDAVKLVPFDGADKSRMILLTPSTGLIGAPEKIETELNKTKGTSKKTKRGWDIKSLLQPRVVPSGLVSVTSKEIPAGSKFTVDSVKHSGDTWEGDWTSDIRILS